MEGYGISWVLVFWQLFNIGLLIAWIALTIIALRQLGHRQFTEQQRLVWVLLIVLVPVLGALAFFLTQPGQQSHSRE